MRGGGDCTKCRDTVTMLFSTIRLDDVLLFKIKFMLLRLCRIWPFAYA